MALLRSLTAKVLLLVALAVVSTTGTLCYAASHAIWAQFVDKQQEEGRRNLRALALVFGEAVPGSNLAFDGDRVARAQVPDLSALSDLSIVDRAVTYVGGNATIFA